MPPGGEIGSAVAALAWSKYKTVGLQWEGPYERELEVGIKSASTIGFKQANSIITCIAQLTQPGKAGGADKAKLLITKQYFAGINGGEINAITHLKVSNNIMSEEPNTRLVALEEHKAIVSSSTAESIDTGTGLKPIIPVTTGKGIIAASTGKDISPESTKQGVATIPSGGAVVACLAEEQRSCRSAYKQIIAVTSIDRIFTFTIECIDKNIITISAQHQILTLSTVNTI